MISDKQAIVSDSEIAFQIRSTTDRRFKLLIIGLSVFLFIAICLAAILATLFAIEQFGSDEKNEKIEEDCVHDPICLEIAAYHRSIANISADPCVNFHNYACGNYERFVGSISSIYDEKTPNSQSAERTRNNLERILGEKIVGSGYENKVKSYYYACLDEYKRESSKGEPLVAALKKSSSIGPWWLFDASLKGYSLQRSVQEAYRIFDADVFFKLQVVPDDQHKINCSTIKLKLGGLGVEYNYKYRESVRSRTLMGYWAYSERKKAVQETYRKYMRNVAQLLARDNGMSLLDSNVNASITTFVNDVYELEAVMAYYYSITVPDSQANLLEKRVKMNDLSSYFASAIDFIVLFNHLYNQTSLETHDDIILEEPDYLVKLGSYVAENLTGPIGERKMNNYIIWRTINARMRDLSSDYREVYFTFVTDYYKAYYSSNRQPFYQSEKDYCVHRVSKYFSYALGSLFVRQHFAESSKSLIDQMVKDIREAIIGELGSKNYFKWMDEKTKQFAVKKLTATTDRVGYPDWLASTKAVDDYYKYFVISNSMGYFQMQSSIAIYKRKSEGFLLARGFTENLWPIKVYDIMLRFWNYYNELLVPAGRLQFPFMAQHFIPNFLNYGSVGQLIAHQMIHAIDSTGRYYDAEGKWVRETWWSNKTKENYLQEYNNARWYYGNQTAGPYKTDTGEWKTYQISPYGARDGMVEIGSVKWAAAAYDNWLSQNGTEKRLPGLIGRTAKQQFYIAYAQNYCFVRSDAKSIENVGWSRVPEDVAVNAALGQNENFLNTFGCSADSPLGSKRMEFKIDVY